MSPSPVLAPRWPAHITATVQAFKACPETNRQQLRARLWPVLHAALYACLRQQAGRVTPVAAEDLEDLASQKALELLLRAEEGVWEIAGRSEPEVAGYVARVARHALIDLARQRGRECPGPEDEDAWAVALAERVAEPVRPEETLVSREFAAALRECTGALAPRARQAWFRRVFLERPSREIAVNLGISAAHVDVVVQRARQSLKECMERKGMRDLEAGPGLFAEVWGQFGPELAAPGDAEDGG